MSGARDVKRNYRDFAALPKAQCRREHAVLQHRRRGRYAPSPDIGDEFMRRSTAQHRLLRLMNVVDPMHRLGLLDHGDVEIHDDRLLPAAHQYA